MQILVLLSLAQLNLSLFSYTGSKYFLFLGTLCSLASSNLSFLYLSLVFSTFLSSNTSRWSRIFLLYSLTFYDLFQKRRIANSSHTRKQRRTNIILLSISIVFFLRYLFLLLITLYCIDPSWLPFSLFCLITEIMDVFENTGQLGERILPFFLFLLQSIWCWYFLSVTWLESHPLALIPSSTASSTRTL